MKGIKFRGRSYDGLLYCGELQWIDDEAYFALHETPPEKRWRTIYTGTHHVDVLPESVAQLIGVTDDGTEVYEGDWLVDENGNEIRAALFATELKGLKLKCGRS